MYIVVEYQMKHTPLANRQEGIRREGQISTKMDDDNEEMDGSQAFTIAVIQGRNVT